MTIQPDPLLPIDRVLQAFEAGNVAELMDHIADDIDFRIDHFHDEADTSWQVAADKAGLMAVLQRLATEVFPKGTRILERHSTPLGDDWSLTRLHQAFFYGVSQCDVNSVTWIISHASQGQLDYFRETVTTIDPVPV